jgi:hypothetical protein
MQNQNQKRYRVGLFVVLTMFVFLMVVTLPIATVSAQTAPTATPTDPIWLGFSAARTAIQDDKKVDLTIVRAWEFFQDDWSTANAAHPQQAAGIDGCVSTTSIVDARQIYYGWTYTITSLRNEVYVARVSFDTKEVAICDLVAVTVVATTASGTPVAGLPAPVAGSATGGSFEVGGHVVGIIGANTDGFMKQAGMKWVKLQINSSTPRDYGPAFIADAKAKGYKVLLSVLGDKNALGVSADAYYPIYTELVGMLAKNGADAIEVWNEANIDREWPQGKINGGEYVKLLSRAYNAIKTANPNTLVISGAPAPTGFFGAAGCGTGGCNDDVFMKQMADAGAAQYMDCVGLHYNEGVLPPSANSGDPRGSYPTYFFSQMLNRGLANFPGKQACWTELGYLSGEGMGATIPPAFNWSPNAPVTVAQQAQYLADAATLSATSGKVRMMIVWNVDFTKWGDDPQGGFAILRPDGKCPACVSLGTVTKK